MQLGMTSAEDVRQGHFRAIVTLGHTGLESADDLVRQAAKRLDIIIRSPVDILVPASSSSGATGDGYPFPTMTSRAKVRAKHHHVRDQSKSSTRLAHRRQRSNTSLASELSLGILPTPVKSSASTASLSTEQWSPTHLETSNPFHDTALDTLKRVQARSTSDVQGLRDESGWTSISNWSMRRSKPSIRNIFSTPKHRVDTSDGTGDTLESLLSDASPPSSPHPLAASLPRSITSIPPHQSSSSLLVAHPDIANIDPALAAAELASALTTHVLCSVCAAQGINFPACRRCGMRFCSRECRVDEKGAGNGKKWVEESIPLVRYC